ncbi:ubiquitin thiolesterase [Angomonas deanei]|uniref:Ubiquitin carboxyl-terminal hydrolase n=1 Tax=Angomonas deanei TaxID=59799 RepID=A0A7G2C7R0_9TRYP|nr:ubiquitin thiolesterase [Angomonas deanei]CAD2215485.1 Ubiquitin carboxyl-terminal hydrolase, putative [Angomonas deanei]|eukprot:EPY35079.1 ubiquitin thiolesterase [Angomonas deanei]
MIEKVKLNEPERKRIIALQMEGDESEYLKSQLAIEKNAQDRANELRKFLGTAPNEPPPVNINNFPENSVPPPLYGNYQNNPYAPGVDAVVPPNAETLHTDPTSRKYVKPKYDKWRFPSRAWSKNCGRRGLVNLGNTCYMNSIIQILNATPIGDYLSDNRYLDQIQRENGNYFKVVNAFSFIVRELRQSNCSYPVSTSSLKSAISSVYEPFNNNSQQDANEFLQVILDSLHSALNAKYNVKTRMAEIDNSTKDDSALAAEYLNQYKLKNSSPIGDMCSFQEKSSVTCPECGRCSRSFNTAQSIEVPLKRNSGKLYLEDCLRAYCREEILDNNSLYLCPGCKKKVNAVKQLQLFSSPEVLFITLKRFSTYGDFSSASKVNDEILFNEKLDLSPFMVLGSSKAQYNLVGIVNHQGNLHGGHYTADAKGTDGAWAHFSDEVVSTQNSPDFQLGYVLCYTRA